MDTAQINMGFQKHIIAVGGGKGGIGKSVICTNLAVGLALSGKNVVLVDTDFGSANLHALLGINFPTHGFMDYFHNNSSDLQSLLLETGIGKLKLVCAAGDNPGSANIDSKSLETIKSFIRNLEADYIFLDLAPGANYSVIDFFNLGHTGLVLTTPEMTSVMSTFSFIRASLFRQISEAFKEQPEIRKLVDHSNPAHADMETYCIDVLKEKLIDMDPAHESTVESIVNSFKPQLVVNRVRYKQELSVGESLIQLVKKYLGVELNYLAYLMESDRVRDSVDEMVPFLMKEPESNPSKNLKKIINALTDTEAQLTTHNGEAFATQHGKVSSGKNT
ncbi:MAG: ATP-binding protein [Nitrospinaceae bacterium]|nr:MAG: ATP-binding protein [Nitrospinaceae bacterium]